MDSEWVAVPVAITIAVFLGFGIQQGCDYEKQQDLTQKALTEACIKAGGTPVSGPNRSFVCVQPRTPGQ